MTIKLFVLIGLTTIMSMDQVRADQPPSGGELLHKAEQALREGKRREALRLAKQAVESDRDRAPGWRLLGRVHAELDEHAEAVVAYQKAIKLDPSAAEPYDALGSEQFMLGQIDESIANFDAFLKLRPELAPHHWKRGISYYYAKRYDEGRGQFERYQSVDDNDVENAVWRFLCMAPSGVEKAQQALLPIKNDARVPMMQVYEMFAGRASPDDVLATARRGDPPADRLNERLFYAHLYIGLYHEAKGEARQALEHIALAADKHQIGHYMWHVARVHAERLRKLAAKAGG